MCQIILKHNRQQLEHTVAEVRLGLVRPVLDADDVEDEACLELVLDGADVNLLLFKLNLHFPLRPIVTDAPHVLVSMSKLRRTLDDHVSSLKIFPQQGHELLEVPRPHDLLWLRELGLDLRVELRGNGGWRPDVIVEPSL